MNKKALHTLEFNKIIEMLSSRAATLPGKDKCMALLPMTDIDDIRNAQTETSQAVSMILKKGSISLGGMKDIGPSVKRVSVGGVLSILELLHIGDFLHASNKAIAYGKDDGKNDNFFMLKPRFEMVMPVDSLTREIERCIMNEQELADDASPGLSTIRRSMKVANERIKEHLNSIIHSQTYKNLLQDNVVTMRGGRFCVPVKAENRNAFSGIVHDQSSTGATLFMEPMSVVSLNNKIKELGIEEVKEIEKILEKLSNHVFEHADTLLSNLAMLTELDFIFAKGELALAMNATEPVFNDKGYINIRKGRHPLLSQSTVVPTDIYLGKHFITLLITGPNTGGKTVSLKTVGLFTLMGQAGLHIAAHDNSELSVFDQVFADIGDEQSIEQNLSTFSSHMSNIVKILGEVTYNSLVLLDELGAGTDPTEGAALAISIIQYLMDRGVRCAVTTHYSELKVFALQTANIENASCEFDVDSLRPTYKLLIGIPGKSNAFAISRRLGLNEDIIEMAKQTLSREDKRFEDLITDLEINRKTVIMEQERAQQYRLEAEKLKNDVENQKQKVAAQRDKIVADAKEEARKVLFQAKTEADALIKELNKSVTAGNRAESENTRKAIRDKMDSLAPGISADNQVKRKPPKTVRMGDGVFIHSLNQRGVAQGGPDGNGDVYVKAGIMKVKVNLSDLSMSEDHTPLSNNKRSSATKAKVGKSLGLSPEVDLRGCMVEEGIEKCDKYLDDAYLAGMKQITIIHGKGTGALRAAITTHLRNHPHVKNYRLGTFGEGENGVTICELK